MMAEQQALNDIGDIRHLDNQPGAAVHLRYGLALTEPEALEDRHGRRFQFLSVAELYSLAPPTWLVKPYLDAKSLAMILASLAL